MKHERLCRVKVSELVAILMLYNQNAFVVINADGSSSFPADGITVEDIDTSPPEVSIGADF